MDMSELTFEKRKDFERNNVIGKVKFLILFYLEIGNNDSPKRHDSIF